MVDASDLGSGELNRRGSSPFACKYFYSIQAARTSSLPVFRLLELKPSLEIALGFYETGKTPRIKSSV